MSKFTDLPIRTQLIVLAVLLTLPALGIIVYSGLKERTNGYRSAAIESQKLADNVAAGVENLIHETEQHASLLSDLPEVKNKDPQKIGQILAKLKNKNPQYNAILIADASGTIWASSQTLDAKKYSIAERAYFKHAKATRRFSSGGFVFGIRTQKPTIHMAYPLVEQGEFRGVVVMGFDLDILRSILERSQLSKNANYILADSDGIIISRGRAFGQEVGKPIQQADLKRMENGPERETYQFRRFDGDPRITTYRKLWLQGEKTPFMYVRAGISRTDTLAEANRSLLINISTLMLFVVVAFVVALIIGKRSISDRVRLLEQASQRLANGDLDFKVSDQVSGGELGSLGRTFDAMAHQLALRELALRESESNYRDIFNATRDALFVHDEESGEIIEANKTAELLFGYGREEILQKQVREPGSGKPPYSLHEALQWIQKSVNECPQEFVWPCKRRNGSLFWAEVACSAKRIAGKRRILVVIRDITERKEVDRIKDEMLSAVSHEMRTPLTAMLGYLQFVLENRVEEAQMREYHGIMLKEAERLNKTINNFLDMQRLKAMQKSYNLKSLEVGRLLQEAADIFASPSDKHRIVVASHPDLPQIFGDEVLLHQMLNNLISNAIKYSANGSEIMLGAKGSEKSVTIWIKDEGLGIPPESQEKIFEIFYRVDNTAIRKTTGTGLGLALVKEIVSAHGGQVWVESTVGMGSTFYIALPVVTDNTVLASQAI